jgi:GWxTD domain-containing protein
MHRVTVLACTLAGLLAGVGSAGAQVAPDTSTGNVAFEYARFWRQAQSETLIDGLVSYTVPGRGLVIAQVDLSVADMAGTQLFEQSVVDTTDFGPLDMQAKSVRLAMPIQFALAPGEYTFRAMVTHGTQRDSTTVRIRALDRAPMISDVLISSRIRALGATDSATSAESKKGNIAIERQPVVTLDTQNPRLSYYAELYRQPNEVDSATLELRVEGINGRELLKTSRRVALGRSDAGTLPLTGLTPGSYRLAFTATAGAVSEKRSASFTVVERPREITAVSTQTNADRLYREYFAPDVRSDSVIAELIGALMLAPPGRPFFSGAASMAPEMQRRALARYWDAMDPVPVTPANELLDEYLGRLDHVARNFTEKHGRRAGYRTARGRIYLKYGLPDRSQLFAQGRRMVEAWRYSQRRGLKFVFYDETGFGNFILVMTNDPDEQSIPDWEGRIGDAEVVRAVLEF